MNKTYYFDLTKVEKKEKLASRRVFDKPKPCKCAHCQKYEIREQVDTLQRGEVSVLTGSAVREAPRFTAIGTGNISMHETSPYAVVSFGPDGSVLRNGFFSSVSEEEERIHRNQRAADWALEVESENVPRTLSTADLSGFI